MVGWKGGGQAQAPKYATGWKLVSQLWATSHFLSK